VACDCICSMQLHCTDIVWVYFEFTWKMADATGVHVSVLILKMNS